VIFIPKNNPLNFESINFDTGGLGATSVGYGLREMPEDTVCELWSLNLIPFSLNVAGQITGGKSTLLSVCKKPGSAPYIAKDHLADYKFPYLDGFVRADEYATLSDVSGKIVEMPLDVPNIEITGMPAGFPVQSHPRGISLKASSEKFFIISVDSVDGQDHNTDVFVRTASDGKWKRLPVPAAATTATDRLRYRLFDDWLATSLSASLAATVTNKDAPDADVLTVTTQGAPPGKPTITVQPRSKPDSSSLPARTLTLYNLADSRRIAIAIPEDDSEIVHVFDGHSVLLRIKDALFFAEIHGSKLEDYKLVAQDSAIPMVHWAFYSSAR
jgi:hypothetical protein